MCTPVDVMCLSCLTEPGRSCAGLNQLLAVALDFACKLEPPWSLRSGHGAGALWQTHSGEPALWHLLSQAAPTHLTPTLYAVRAFGWHWCRLAAQRELVPASLHSQAAAALSQGHRQFHAVGFQGLQLVLGYSDSTLDSQCSASCCSQAAHALCQHLHTGAPAAPLQGVQLVLYGDSILESWLEKDVGAPCPAGRCAGLKAVFDSYFGHWSSMVLALGSEVCGLLSCLMLALERRSLCCAVLCCVVLVTLCCQALLVELRPDWH